MKNKTRAIAWKGGIDEVVLHVTIGPYELHRLRLLILHRRKYFVLAVRPGISTS
jgi:hypothetical protein